MTEEYLKLQESIAFIDLLYERSSGNGMEILIAKKSPIQFRMEPDPNHKMPHIHITLGKLHHYASYSIQNGSILTGLSSRYDKTVIAWIDEHRDKLVELWNTLQDGKPYVHVVEAIRQF